MNPNSLKALKEEKRKLSRRELEILGVLHKSWNGMTDRQVMQALGYSDMNAVRPRCNELIEGVWVKVIDNVKDEITGKTVRLLRAIPSWERQNILKRLEEEHNDNQLRLL